MKIHKLLSLALAAAFFAAALSGCTVIDPQGGWSETSLSEDLAAQGGATLPPATAALTAASTSPLPAEPQTPVGTGSPAEASPAAAATASPDVTQATAPAATQTPEPIATPAAATPTPEPIATPAATAPSAGSTAAPLEGGTVEASFFDDAVFIGDSVTLKLQRYCLSTSALGTAKFLCAGSFSVEHAVSYSLSPTYQGAEVHVEDGVAAMGAGKVFLMLGMNDIAPYGIDNTIVKWGKLVDNILAQSPDAQIFIQSVTPILTGKEGKKLTNANVDKYNAALEQFCADNGYTYIAVAPYFKAADGSLQASYCSDPDSQGIHMTDAGCAVWVDVLRHACAQ